MRQISASKRSQNVVEIAIIDYCDFEAGILFHSITSVNLSPQRKTQDIIALLQKHKISSFVSRQLFTASFQYELWQSGYRQARQSIV